MTRMALVTGASRGIGAAIARRLAADALHVIVNYRTNREKAEQVVDDVRAAGGSAEAWGFDVRDREATTRAVEALLERDTPLEVLINNAGVAADAPFPALEPDAWEDVTRTTLDGFYNVTRPLVMPMVRRRRGRIINISSVSGVIGNRGQVNYSAAKAGLIGATRALARELAKRRITVNAVAPGLIETDMIQDAPVEEVLKVVPMQRLGTPDEVADLVSFLASDRAGYITGQVIGVNGGLA